MKKHISILTPTYNEEDNIGNLVGVIREVFDKSPQYTYEHVIIDNFSKDNTVNILRDIAAKDKNVKVILNARNFGWIRSPYYGITQCFGDAVIYLVADFQDPPELIPQFLEKWQEGYRLVIGEKIQSKENWFIFKLRRVFYKLMSTVADENPPIENFTGFGCYDKQVVDEFRNIQDQYPYLRGLITEFGYEVCKIPYVQPIRKAGKSNASILRLYDVAMLGFTNHSKFPLRLSAILGFLGSIFSLFAALIYVVLKIIYWNEYQIGIASLVIGLFFFASVQLFFIGLVGEYIAAINIQVRKRPLVVERERINFQEKD